MVCDECIRIDRTRRRIGRTNTEPPAASIRVQKGEIAEGLRQYRGALQHFDWVGDRLQISVVFSDMAEAVAPIGLPTAIHLAAIAESDVIAPFATFGAPQCPNLATRIGELERSQVETARSTAAAMSYDDALRFVFATIDRLTDESPEPSRSHGREGSSPGVMWVIEDRRAPRARITPDRR